MVPKKGLEPPRDFSHSHLKAACLPISPLRHIIELCHRILKRNVPYLGNLIKLYMREITTFNSSYPSTSSG
ncbi:MAG: hypothetical protein ACD_64C00345G0001, partial [uncultured bacterium]